MSDMRLEDVYAIIGELYLNTNQSYRRLMQEHQKLIAQHNQLIREAQEQIEKAEQSRDDALRLVSEKYATDMRAENALRGHVQERVQEHRVGQVMERGTD
jgi:hypothetical protein